jgi:CRP-like cAMP-binding protein
MQRNELTFPKQSFLGSVNDESWGILSSLWSVNLYKSGQFLITADDDVGDVFFILRGAAKATIYTPTGREVSFISMNVGDCFGEFAAIDDSPRSASVVAAGECLAARLSPSVYVDLLRTNPDISFCSMNILVAHLRQLSKRVVDFNIKTADERLREALLELAIKHSRGQDEVLIERPPTQSELAAFVFSSRESVAREMGRMRKAGIIGRKKRSLYVPSIEALRKLVENT